jgi:hypothetical protein
MAVMMMATKIMLMRGNVGIPIAFERFMTDRATPARIASRLCNQSVSCEALSFVDVIASPSIDAAIASDGAVVSGSLFAATSCDGADVSALVVSADDSESSSR